MALSEEQQEWLVAQATALVDRVTSLAKQHYDLIDDGAGLQLASPVGRHAGPASIQV